MPKIKQILTHYDIAVPYQIKRLTTGLIHQTFHITHIQSNSSHQTSHQPEHSQWILQGRLAACLVQYQC